MIKLPDNLNPLKKKKPVEPLQTTSASNPPTGLTEGLVSVQDIIAPASIEVDFDNLKIGNRYFRTMFVAGYPRFVSANWLAPLINFHSSLDVSMFIYPVESKNILSDLKRKIAEMEATIESDIKRGKVIDPNVQVALDDALTLQEQLAKGAEKFFQFGLYVTISADSPDDLNQLSKEVSSTLGALLIISKPATLQMEDGFKTTSPTCLDKLMITRNMDTTSLATTFPFTSSELTANTGVLYGLNEHNGSLIIFDRFTLENANEVVLGKSGSGKSFLVKLEALRSLMFGTDVIIIDPEEEYRTLCESVGGDYISFAFGSDKHINPFDMSGMGETGENELQVKVGFTLTRLLKIMVDTHSAEEEAIIHNALEMTYKQKGITYDPSTHKNEPPLLEDLYRTLIGMETQSAQNIALRLEKYVKGSFGGVFNQKSNIDLENSFTVFSFKNLEDQIRALAIFVIMDYVWNQIKRKMKRRILIVDEGWYLMKNPNSAEFLWGFAKRARKYYLGLTTITQDIEDFLSTDLGKTIVTNSSIQMLMKQSPAAIDRIADVFYLSQGEKSLLLSANVGEGLFFAGSSHVAMQVVASPEEHKLITSKPEEVMQQQKILAEQQAQQQQAFQSKINNHLTSNETVLPETPPAKNMTTAVSKEPAAAPTAHVLPDLDQILKPTTPGLPPADSPIQTQPPVTTGPAPALPHEQTQENPLL